MPAVVGEIAAGCLIGPSWLGWVRANEPLEVLAELGAVLLLFAFGKRVYFPMRFESVIAAPLVLWLATVRWRAPALTAIGAAVLIFGIRDHLERPIHPYREAATVRAVPVTRARRRRPAGWRRTWIAMRRPGTRAQMTTCLAR